MQKLGGKTKSIMMFSDSANFVVLHLRVARARFLVKQRPCSQSHQSQERAQVVIV